MSAQSDKIGRVAIVGGTHGNELNGIYLARNLKANPELARRESFETEVLEGNPEAVKINRRYVEEDLNRCFSLERLAAPESERKTYEARRAAEIDAYLGPKTAEKRKFDMVLDLHNTTANTGVVLLMKPTDLLALRLAAYLCHVDSTVRVCLWQFGGDPPLLPSTAHHGLTIEVGPVPTGVLEPTLYAQTRTLVNHALDFLHDHNINGPLQATVPKTLPAFTGTTQIEYVRDSEGELASMVPAALQNKDFTQIIRTGDTLLVDFGPDALPVKRYEGEKPTYAFFINEAAYLEKNLAFVLCKPQVIDLSDGSVTDAPVE